MDLNHRSQSRTGVAIWHESYNFRSFDRLDTTPISACLSRLPAVFPAVSKIYRVCGNNMIRMVEVAGVEPVSRLRPILKILTR